MRSILIRTRESFWFLPALLGVAAIVSAELIVLLDRSLQAAGMTGVFFLDALSATGGRSILSIIGTSMLTVAGTTFSITISVLATTSSTYGPRLVRNFLADRANQLVLAVFTSTFLYALVVLRSVRAADDSAGGFVPTIAIHIAVLLGVLDVAFLVFFIHHIARSVQITTLQQRVQVDLERAVDVVYPAGDQENSTRRARPAVLGAIVASRESGYVEQVGLDALRHIAEEHDGVIDVVAMPGTHLIAGEPLARVSTTLESGTDLDGQIRRAFTLGTSRTPYQDVRFALQQLVEIAVRGLASGSNDPYTAVTALDLSATALVPLWTREEAPTGLVDDDGVVRVVLHWPDAADLIASVFDGVLVYGTEHPLVIDAALHLLDRLRAAAGPERRDELTAVTARLAAARGTFA
ncbi:MAG: DUF2254 domain-containing protein [Burkholderiaceae bacterium]|nr:DUF2254 domain-containing protein [Microbacteriaceae bacterium]